MTIPNEAIEAAHKAYSEVALRQISTGKQWIEEAILAALEAALPLLMPQPSENEVVRVAKAIFCFGQWPKEAERSFNNLNEHQRKYSFELATAAIAAMNRAPQRTYDDGLRRATEIAKSFGRLMSNSADTKFAELIAESILAELKPQGEWR